MKKIKFSQVSTLCLSLLITLMPVLICAQPGPAAHSTPPISSPIVREGEFAIRLEFWLGVGTTDDEAEAENRLAEVGILPRNGWIADYPVTPDVAGELQQAVIDAAASGKISLSRDEALKRFNDTLSEFGLSLTPYPSQEPTEAYSTNTDNYPNPSAVDNYYYREGPPVVTYYTPPPAFYYMYAWVPFPFLWSGFWFPGYFILHDFHKTVVVNRRVVFVSNHFRDIRSHRVFRVDPVARFRGRTFGGIGAGRTRGLLSTGIPGSDRRIFNSPAPRNLPMINQPAARGHIVRPPSRGNVTVTPPALRGGTPAPPTRGRILSPAPRGGEAVRPPSRGSGPSERGRGR